MNTIVSSPCRQPGEMSGRHQSCLVVGHHQATLTMIEGVLKLEGYQVAVAHAREAWIEQAIAPGANFFAILLDVGYPIDATVASLFSHLRSCWEAAHHRMPPLVVLTENPYVPLLVTCQVLLKPFHLKDLYYTLEQVRDGNHHLPLVENNTGGAENEHASEQAACADGSTIAGRSRHP